MKKLISMALSIVMVMSLVIIPVQADASTVVTPATEAVEPTYHISPSVANLKLKDSNGVYNIDNTNFNTTPVAVDQGTIFTASKVVSRFSRAYIYNADAEGADQVTAWEGYKLPADTAVNYNNLYPGYGSLGSSPAAISIKAPASFKDKDLRADSVRFMLPEQGEAENAGVALFGGSNVQYYPTVEAVKPTALRIVNGGAKTKKLESGSTAWVNFIEDGTIQPNKWYRAERILDTRIDDGIGTKDNLYGLAASGGSGENAWATTTENWQRFIVYEETENGDSIVGDSGWVMTSRYTKNESGAEAAVGYPFANTAFYPFNYPTGSYVYIDDIKAWAIDTPVNSYDIEGETDYGNMLSFPTASKYGSWYTYKTFGTYVGKETGNWGKAKAIYLQEDFMLPEATTSEISLLDIVTRTSPGSTSASSGNAVTYTGGAIRINGTTLTVKEWDSSSTGYKTDALTFKGEVGSSLELSPNTWYTATLKINQDALLDGGYMIGDGAANKGPTWYKTDETTEKITADHKQKASVIITAADGTVLAETDEFDYKSPSYYDDWGSMMVAVFAESLKVGANTTYDFKLLVDNFKMVFSDGAIDSENAAVKVERTFDDIEPGTAYTQTGTCLGSMKHSAVVEKTGEYKIEGIPTTFAIDLGQAVDKEAIEAGLKLYLGSIDVTDEQLSNVQYDADTNIITGEFISLSPATEYTLSMDRDVTMAEANIFSVLAGETGKETGFTFTTGITNETRLIYTPGFQISFEEFDLYDSFADYLEVYPIEGNGNPIIFANNASVKNYTDAPIAFIAIAATYDNNGILENLMAESLTAPENGEVPVTFGFDAEAEDPVGYLMVTENTKTFKSFIWNTWRLMQPFEGSYLFPRVQ